MSTERQQLEAAIGALESQRVLLGDALVDKALAPLRAKLDGLATPIAVEPGGQTLKQVTILFLDVVGSTSLSQRLDPEDIHAVVNGAMVRFAAVIEAHQGRVLRFMGDGMLAAFGADSVREDDPERAVRAGLALLDAGKRHAAEVVNQYQLDGFDVRVGIHTGTALLGDGVEAENNVMGMALNIAARMEQTAPPGTLRISYDTYRHVRGVFDVEQQPPIHVKGVDEPIVTFLVQRARPRAFRVATRGIEGVDTRMVGRDAELNRLQDAFESLFRRGSGFASVTVVADAGIGKSRLLYEFQSWADTRAQTFHVFTGRAYPSMQSQPYGLLRDILAGRLQIGDGDSMDAAKRKLEQGTASLFTGNDRDLAAQAHAHLLGHLLGLDYADSKHIKGIGDDPRQIRSRGFHAAAQMFRSVARQAPVVLLLDDLHWADDGSLDFLSHLGNVNHDVPLLMLGLTRPTLFERRADWPGLANARRIDLQPLDDAASQLLAGELLKRLDASPSTLYELIGSSAEGNPFYMEELVKMLVDEGAIETRGERWKLVPGRLRTLLVPQTLTGVLQARLDGLKPAEKLALQQASVIGFVFWDQALAAIDGQATAPLPDLTERAMVIAHPEARVDGLHEYAFHHQILHHVTYDTVLKRLRREYHAKVAAWLAGRTGARANDFLGATAEHYEKAGDDRRACEFYARAAEHAAGRFAHEATMSYVARALALMDKDSSVDQSASVDDLSLHWRLLDVRERTLDLQGKRPDQRADIAALQELAEALHDDRRSADVAWRRCDIALRTGDFHTQEEAARQAMALAALAGDDELRLRAQQRLASALTLLGDHAAGRTLAQEGLASARSLALRKVEGLFLNLLSIIASMQDEQLEHLELGQQRLLIDRELGNSHGEAITLGNLGNAWMALGQYDQARLNLEEALRLTRVVGDRGSEPLPLICLSALALYRGETATARDHALSARDIAVAVQSPEFETSALRALGDVELALGDHAAADAAYERAHAVALTIDDAMQHDATAGLARVALARGDGARALVLVEGLLAHLDDGGTLDGTESPRTIELCCHQVLARAGDPRASDLLARAHAELQVRAAAITDPALRDSFLNQIPEHREIVATWAAHHAASSGPGSAAKSEPER